jgi:hypothetical protein
MAEVNFWKEFQENQTSREISEIIVREVDLGHKLILVDVDIGALVYKLILHIQHLHSIILFVLFILFGFDKKGRPHSDSLAFLVEIFLLDVWSHAYGPTSAVSSMARLLRWLEAIRGNIFNSVIFKFIFTFKPLVMFMLACFSLGLIWI